MLKPKIINSIKEDKILIAKIASIRDVETQTVDRWLELNHCNLMHLFILEEIASHFNLKLIDLYEKHLKGS